MKLSARLLLPLLAMGSMQTYAAPSAMADSTAVAADIVQARIQLDTKDYPERYRDKDQNRLGDGRESATVPRLKRGGFFLLPDSLFQVQRFSKKYPGKRFMDRAMIDIGGGLTYGIGRDIYGMYRMGAQPSATLGLGDWTTPEHGWRVSLSAGRMPLSQWSAKDGTRRNFREMFAGVSAEYMLNFSAIGNRLYEHPRPLEFYGMMGLDGGLLNHKVESSGRSFRYYVGAHLGLRGVYNFAPAGYLYLQPTVSIYSPQGMFTPSDKGSNHYALGLGLTAGIGLRRSGDLIVKREVGDTLSSVGNDWFIQGAVGLAVPLEYTHGYGPQAVVGIGKWLNYCNGLRANVTAGTHRNPSGQNRLVSIGMGVDYLWSINRFFSRHATYERTQEPRVGMNFLIGGGVHGVDDNITGRYFAVRGGVGLQFNVRVARMSEIYLEPRVDIYSKNYLPGIPSYGSRNPDVVASLYAGLAFHQGMHTRWLRESRNPFFKKSPYDHYFIQVAAGGITPIAGQTIRAVHQKFLISPAAQVGVGTWFTATHGVRVYADGGFIKETATSGREKYASIGAEYLWNITNALAGYRERRPFEFVGGLGFNNGFIFGKVRKFNPALSATLQAHYYFNPRWSIFAEPQMRFYVKDLLSHTGSKVDPVATFMIGAQLRTMGYDYRLARDTFQLSRQRFIGGGIGMINRGSINSKGGLGRVEIGRWFTPIMALRGTATVEGFYQDPFWKGGRHERVLLGGDYMIDLSQMSYGYRSERLFSARPFIGANVGAGFYQERNVQWEGDVHAGMQLAFRIGNNAEFFIEPQLAYLLGHNEGNRMAHFAPSVMVGGHKYLSSFRGMGRQIGNDIRAIRQANREASPWSHEGKAYNKLFFEAGVGPHIIMSRTTMMNKRPYLGYEAYVGIGRWMNEVNGLRLRLNSIRSKVPVEGSPKVLDQMGIGLEYACNISNAIWHYDTQRPFDITAFVGPHFQLVRDDNKFNLGVNIALQPMWNISRLYSLFLMPELTMFKEGVLYRDSEHKLNIQRAVMLGLQVHPENYQRAASQRIYDESDGHIFFSMSAGATKPMEGLMHDRRMIGALGRISYGCWFTPVSAWRVSMLGWAYPHTPHSKSRGVSAALGGDYMLDITNLSGTYNPNRIFHLRPFIGANLGVGYMASTDALLHCQPDVHLGAQFAARAGQRFELFLEPQVAHAWSGFGEESRLTRVQPSVMAGLTYRINSYKEIRLQDEQQRGATPRHYVSIASGTGCHTHTINNHFVNRNRRWGFEADINYGYWFNGLSGLRAGLSMSNYYLSARRTPRRRQNNMMLHVDYMVNVLNLFSGYDKSDSHMELNAFAGLNYSFAKASGESMRHGMGGELGIQIGVRATRHFVIFIEPTAIVTTPKLYSNNFHPIDGTARIMLGAKYAF